MYDILWPLTLEKARHILELWNVIGRIAALLLEDGKDLSVFGAGMRRKELHQLAVHRAPDFNFRGGVVDARNDVAAVKK